MTLDEMKCGDRGVIAGVDIGEERMRELGLVCGTGIIVVRRAPAGDPIEVAVRGYHLTLRRELAKRIRVTLA